MGKLSAILAAGALLLVAPAVHARTSAFPTCFGAPATIVGTNGNDVIYGTNFDDVIVALGGADQVHGRAGNDRLCGNGGGDTLFDGFGADRIDGGYGIDTLYLCPDGAPDSWVNVERVIQSQLGCN
jgi:hypothetical protein